MLAMTGGRFIVQVGDDQYILEFDRLIQELRLVSRFEDTLELINLGHCEKLDFDREKKRKTSPWRKVRAAYHAIVR